MISLLLFLFLLCIVNGLPTANITRSRTPPKLSVPGIKYRIVGGRPAEICKYPYTAAIIYNDTLIGSGAVLNKYWITSAANELRSYVSDTLTVRVGSEDSTAGGQLHYSSKVIINENYSGGFSYNVAVIKLNSSIEFGKNVKPITMARSRPKPSSKAVITGWGKQTAIEEKGTHLQVAHVSVVSDIECEASHVVIDINNSLCADRSGVGPCYGDKGVPLVSNKKLVGHFIGGNMCNLVLFPEVYSSIAAYRKWVINTIIRNSVGQEARGIN